MFSPKRACLSISVSQLPQGSRPAWYLSSVSILNIKDSHPLTFPAELWIEPSTTPTEDGVFLYPIGTVRASYSTKYRITTVTSDVPKAGTNSQVSLHMIGTEGKTEKISLVDNSGCSFIRGETSSCDICVKNIGTIQRIVLSKEGKGTGADWHLKMVIIEDLSSREKLYFWNNTWVGEQKTLYAISADPRAHLFRYKVSVH